jgi:hypothetical protein
LGKGRRNEHGKTPQKGSQQGIEILHEGTARKQRFMKVNSQRL